MSLDFPSAKTARERLDSLENQVFSNQIKELRERITIAISNGNSYVTCNSLHEKTIRFLRSQGYVVNVKEDQRDTCYHVSW